MTGVCITYQKHRIAGGVSGVFSRVQRIDLQICGAILVSIICCILALTSMPPAAQGASLGHDRSQFPASAAGSDVVFQGLIDEDAPTITAPFAALSTRNGVELFARGGDVERAMASTTKMTTALVVDNAVRAGKMSYQDVVVVSPDALVNEASVGLAAHDRVSLRDLMQGALVHSGNDAAAALALSQSPSIPAFADQMNAYVTDNLKLSHTHYVNPHGLDAADHYSCARDLVVIGAEVLRRPQLAAIVRKPHARIVLSGTPHIIESTFADALNSSPKIDGVKTGFTDNAGGCLVLAAHKDGMGLIACVMGSSLQERQSEAISLLTWGFNHLPKRTFAYAHQPFITIPVGDRFGYSVAVNYQSTASFKTLPQAAPIYKHWARKKRLTWAEAMKPTSIGSVAWTQGDDYLGSVALTTQGQPFRERARLPWQRSLY